MQFVGTQEYQLDDRNRVPIPPGYRAAFKDGGYIQGGTDAYLILHTPASFEQAAAVIEELPEETDEGEEARRDFYGSTWAIQPDAQGRVVMTREMLEHAALTREVIVVGTGRRMEIWDRANYASREEQRKASRRSAMNRRVATTGSEGA